MTDGPVLGQVGLVSKQHAVKIEIVGELTPREWEEFVECVRECARRFKGKIKITYKRYKLRARKRRTR